MPVSKTIHPWRNLVSWKSFVVSLTFKQQVLIVRMPFTMRNCSTRPYPRSFSMKGASVKSNVQPVVNFVGFWSTVLGLAAAVAFVMFAISHILSYVLHKLRQPHSS